MAVRPLLPKIAGLFFVTGATALIVEQTFEKLLSTVVGASTPAGALVLAAYFAGLSLGGAAYGRWATRFRSPLSLYGFLEAAVGLLAIFLAGSFAEVQTLSSVLVQLAGDAPEAVFVARLAVSALWILPPTLAMGASYPAVCGALEAEAGGDEEARREVPRAMTRLYAVNLLGATLAAFAGPYVLFPRFGLTGTLAGFGALQLLIGLVALRLARQLTPAPVVGTAAAPEDARPLGRLLREAGMPLLLPLAGASGFMVFALEVMWIHLIGVTLGMSVYAFAMMLTMVLLGLFLGGLGASVFPRDGRGHAALALPGLLVVCSVSVLIAGGAWDSAPLWLLEYGEDVDTFWTGEVLRFLLAVRLILVPSIALGTIYPSLLRSPLFPHLGRARAAGWLGAANAVGSVLGALAAAFWLLPRFGSESTLRALGAMPALFALGLVVLTARFAGPSALPRFALPAAVASLLGVGALAVLPPPWNRLDLTAGTNVYFRRSFVSEDSRLLSWFEDAAGGITTVVERQTPGGAVKTLLTNGKFQGNNAGELSSQISFGLVPSVLRAARARAMWIGLGTGQSALVVKAAGFERLDVAELSPGMIAAAREQFDDVNGHVLEAPGVSLFLEDGRNFLLRTRQRYDLIGMEVTSIWFAGASNLYSREFYRLARSRLAPHGVLQQWVQLHHASPEEVMSVIATVRAEFRHVTVWKLGAQGCIVAADEPLAIDPVAMADVAAAPKMAPLLAIVARQTGLTLGNLHDALLLDEGDVTRLAEAVERERVPLNTDGNRHLEFESPRYNLEKLQHQRFVLERLLSFTDQATRPARTERFLAPLLRRGPPPAATP